LGSVLVGVQRGFAALVGLFKKKWARGGAVETAPFQSDAAIVISHGAKRGLRRVHEFSDPCGWFSARLKPGPDTGSPYRAVFADLGSVLVWVQRGFAALVGLFKKNWARGGAVETAPFQSGEEVVQMQAKVWADGRECLQGRG
jgi:hypothetical protein